LHGLLLLRVVDGDSGKLALQVALLAF
jgi:hypothetical protein